MQPFDDYDGRRVQQRSGNQRSGGSETQYRSKPFTDLVDEDKHAFVKRRVLSTILGGHRIVGNEVEETYVGVGLHIGQILICLIMPLWISACVIVFGLKDGRTAGCIAGGAVPLVINLILMGTSYKLRKEGKAEDDDEVSCCSKAGFLFLFPAKAGLLEIAYCSLLTFAYGALMTYAFHPATMMSLYGVEQSFASNIPQLILIGLSSYSLFSQHCPESAIYRDNDQELDWGSNHYQRVIFYILIAVGLIVNENVQEEMLAAAAKAVSSTTGSTLNAQTLRSDIHEYLYISFIVIYALQIFGLLSHPLVNIFWAAEQANIHLFGSTARASDGRIVLYFVLNAVFVVICFKVRAQGDTDDAKQWFTLCTILLSFLASHNVFAGLLVRKPFKVANERLKSQRQYADIVFAGKHSNVGSEEPSNKRVWVNIGVSFVLGIALAAMATTMTQPSEEGMKEELGIAGTLYYAALVLFVIHWLFSASSRFSVFRVIPCPQRKVGDSSTIACRFIQILITLCLTPLYIKISGMPAGESDFMRALLIISIYRSFSKLFHNPLGAVIESSACLIYRSPIALTVAAFGLNRLYILIRKLIYVMVSVITALKNTKQRFSGQAICFALQFTVFLPITLGVILVTTLLDTATIPYLGFAFFIIGYPKPLRGWSSINPVEVNPNDSRSDGHLYQAMLSQLSVELQQLIGSDPFNFGCGSYYFMKNEKMILLIQVLERGNNYVMITVKGTELQETTVCHAEENDRINQVTEQVFDKEQRDAHFAFSLSPLKQITFGVYDDQKVSMTGIIENPEFETLVKRAYVRVLLLQLGDHFQAKKSARLVSIFSSELSDKELRANQSFEDRGWIAHLQFDHHNVQFSTKRLASDAASAQSFSQNKVQPAGRRSEPERSSQPVSFLDRVESEGRQRASRETSNRVRRSEDRRSQAEDRPSFGSDKRTQGVAARPAPQSYGVVLPSVPAAVAQPTLSVPKRPVKAKPADDLDELEDMLAGLEGGSDDLDDLLDELGPPAKKPKAPAGLSAKYRQQERDELDELDALGVKTEPAASAGYTEWDKPRRVQEPRGHGGGYPASPGARTRAEPSASSGGAAADRLADWDRDVKRTHSPLHARARTPRSSHGNVRKSQDHGTSDIERFAAQSFTLLFGDEFQNMPLTLLSIFKGNLKRNFTNRDFLDSNDVDALHLKYIMLHSARLAFHYSLEAFIMGESELPDYRAFEDEIRGYDQEWFLGSEEYLWNAAIERKLPNLERLIQKKDGQYVTHRLKFGQSAESTFSVFEFRREVIRGIWANLNMELLYYTNANDERFSIQAEKDILRNLLVQLAEVPLGYPVFSSGAHSISI